MRRRGEEEKGVTVKEQEVLGWWVGGWWVW